MEQHNELEILKSSLCLSIFLHFTLTEMNLVYSVT